jgi:hypothetical protein
MVWPFSTRDAKTINNEIDNLRKELKQNWTRTKSLNELPDKSLASQAADAEQPDTDPQITIQIFGSDDENSKGFFINGYKINTHNLNNLNKTFSTNDQVKDFFKNLIGYIENNNLPKDKQLDPKNFFHSYTKTIDIEPIRKDQPEQEGGKKKKRSRKRKSKSKPRKTRKH